MHSYTIHIQTVHSLLKASLTGLFPYKVYYFSSRGKVLSYSLAPILSIFYVSYLNSKEVLSIYSLPKTSVLQAGVNIEHPTTFLSNTYFILAKIDDFSFYLAVWSEPGWVNISLVMEKNSPAIILKKK